MDRQEEEIFQFLQKARADGRGKRNWRQSERPGRKDRGWGRLEEAWPASTKKGAWSLAGKSRVRSNEER
jgi:hypothetical protein